MHLIHQLGAGGAENGIINIVNHIDQDHVESAICAFVGQGSQEKRVDTKQTSLFDLGKKPGNDFGLPFRLSRLLKSWQADIVHTHAWGTLCEGVAGAKLSRVPGLIHGEHGTIQKKRLNLSVQRKVWHLADRVLSVSEPHRSRLAETVEFPKEKILVICNGVDTERFFPAKDRLFTRQALGYKKDDIVIGTAGRFMPVKNQALLIRGFALASKKMANLKLMLVGDGPLKSKLQTLVSDLGMEAQVLFAGRRADMPEVMNTMDLFVLPSLSEGMSNTILEAMSCALPVIATDVGGNPELVRQERTGLLFPSEDPEALAQAIHEMVLFPENRIQYGKAGRTLVEEEYSLKRMVSRYDALYQDVCAAKGFY